MFSKVFAATAIAAAISSVLAGECTRKYTAVEGDFCDWISAAESVSTYQLAAISAGLIDESCKNLVPGQEYCLGYEGEDCTETYVVKADDTIDSISAAAGIDVALITENNPQINEDFSNVYIGEVLCVAKEVTVPAVAGSVPKAVLPPYVTPVAPAVEEDDDDLPFCDEI